LKDKIVKNGRWEFDQEVTEVFDDMLSRSIPDYDGMREVVTDVALRFARPGTQILDLGCSRGGAMAGIAERNSENLRFIGIEMSSPMAAAARKNLEQLGIDAEILELDLRYEFPEVTSCSTILSVLTLQFTPIEYRQSILGKVFATLQPGGCFILVEKVLAGSLQLDQMLTDIYYERKGANGYTAEQIDSKKRSLEGVLVPVTARWNEELMISAGFSSVECVWRNLQFACWVALKT
jgi:tRNA (cmo5U34)-methyltransferase